MSFSIEVMNIKPLVTAGAAATLLLVTACSGESGTAGTSPSTTAATSTTATSAMEKHGDAMMEKTTEAMEKPAGDAMMEKTSEAMEKPAGDAMMEKTSDAMEKPAGDAMEKHDDAMMHAEATTQTQAMAAEETKTMPGRYISYADYQAAQAAGNMTGKNVLFFNATWCPDCRAIHQALTANPQQIPDDVTIVSVDYDTNRDLRRKYGVTMQTTFVQVDAEGNKQGQWVATSPAGVFDKIV